jgi:uncharacterized cysteine cluster protein YcgN (CxxCxxCC family)
MNRFKKMLMPDRSLSFLPMPFNCDGCGVFLRRDVYTDTRETRFKTMYCSGCVAAMTACDEHDERKAWED